MLTPIISAQEEKDQVVMQKNQIKVTIKKNIEVKEDEESKKNNRKKSSNANIFI